jgi:hypothetical protein
VADIDPFEGAPSLPKIVAISLQQTGHLYNFLAGDRLLRRGERVLVESEARASALSRLSRTSPLRRSIFRSYVRSFALPATTTSISSRKISRARRKRAACASSAFVSAESR